MTLRVEHDYPYIFCVVLRVGMGPHLDIFRIQVAREGNMAGQTEISEMQRLEGTGDEPKNQRPTF